MSLTSSVFFSILVNGSPSTSFSPTWGIHQGNLLSPFLFILMAEGLGRLLNNPLAERKIKGISLHNNPSLSRQQFVDNNLLIGHPSVQESQALKHNFQIFSNTSRTYLKLDKSQFFFFNTPTITQRNISRILGFSISSLPTKYLGASLIELAIKHYTWREFRQTRAKSSLLYISITKYTWASYSSQIVFAVHSFVSTFSPSCP